MPAVFQHTLDLKTPQTRLKKHARNPAIGQDVILAGCQRVADTGSVTDREVGVPSERGGLERDLVGPRFLRLSGIQGCLTRDAQFHFRQGISADCFRGNGTAQVDEEDPVPDGNRISREDTLHGFRTRLTLGLDRARSRGIPL